MKILVAHTFYQQPGGEDTVFKQEVAMLRQAGHEVATYTRSNDEIKHYNFVDKALLFPRTIWSPASQSEFGSVLDRERPHVVHFHNTFMVMSPSVYAACKDRGIPVVQTLHNFRLCCPGGAFFRDGHPCEDCSTSGLWNSVVHGCYRNSRSATATVASMLSANRVLGTWSHLVDCYIALTQFARDRMHGSGIPAQKIHVKPNFLAEDPGVRTTVGDYAVFSGRIVAEKGARTLVNAWKGLDNTISLRVLGDGALRRDLQADCQNLGVQNIHFYGLKPRHEVLEHVRSAQFVVFPSESYENFPMAIVESFASGVPVIASNMGSTAEIVHDGVTGLTFAPGNTADLREKVKWAIAHPDLMRAMGRRARAEFEVKYSAVPNYKMLMGIYETALGEATVIEPVALPEVA